ncbi:Nucleotide-binding universal stress protein, UspA family [Halovenus aranensis]|jgi:nucleotide-binding universal stress UspA family protein|uniref:Nucleotide-binding universal stress protein, UspA family n=1 Tax=Halovenus aranensis TaxID=890420 RepID=A0A1G8XH20_9EURY|nr:universal stress protein [Halovenus aranensis]SDJ89275.1 Nucleotide-binding universal stress protein, UspA family [Halovenus aranensis]
MSYIVAADGSEESNDAVRYAATHAATFGESLEIVHVITLDTELVDGDVVMQGRETATDEGHDTLEDAQAVARDAVPSADLDIETQLLTGRPATAVADRATAADAEAIFVGHRGLSTEQEAVVGSVAKEIVSKATVPVTVVR